MNNIYFEKCYNNNMHEIQLSGLFEWPKLTSTIVKGNLFAYRLILLNKIDKIQKITAAIKMCASNRVTYYLISAEVHS